MLRNLKSLNMAELEEKVLSLWKERSVFEKSLQPKKKGAPEFHFWEGPPTANGRPGIHHVLARSFKDIFLRYKTMRGFVAPRKGGWDTHGLPVEIQVEKQLGLSSKKEIEKYGIEAFNQKCKESVWMYKSEWEKLTDRMGYWLDLDDPYITYENSYIETLWFIIKRVWDKGMLYRGYKIVNWCPRCGTGLSSHELAQGYKETTDTSVYVKFKIKKGQKIGSFVADDKTYVLSWTTTPWTLPGNVALAVGKNISYVVLRSQRSGESFVLAKDRVEQVFKNFEGSSCVSLKGKDLIGVSYAPLFDVSALKSDASHRIYDADFVTTTDGTGVVHTAVMYGEDDYRLGVAVGLPQHHTVDESGHFTKDVEELAGLYVKDEKTEEKILSYLKEGNYLLGSEEYTHEYPFCWRCDTPLLYYARSSWFVAMSKLRPTLKKLNQEINWIPPHIKKGRFGEWIGEVKDWNFSRERYWGTPLPIWQCKKCDAYTVVGSRDEISELSKEKSQNRYFVLRHGLSENNVKSLSNCDPKDKDEFALTKKGRLEAEKAATRLKKEKIDIIIASDFRRVKETADIVAEHLGIKKVIFDKRLREINIGALSSRPVKEYDDHFPRYQDQFEKTPEGGENLVDVARRSFEFLKDVEEKYAGKNILIVGHEYPIWMLVSVLKGWDQYHAIQERKRRGGTFILNGQIEEARFLSLPRDKNGLGDFHRPYVDDVVLACSACGGDAERVREIADVWFDSGSMPFAQEHWPFGENKKEKGKKKNAEVMPNNFPADYIAEGIDQTRGWFYTLLAVATLMGTKEAPYKNVISLGLVHDKNGQKMSKSRGNVVDPWAIMDKYGADPLRWYLYTLNAPGDAKNFDEGEIGKIVRRLFLVLYNSFVFLHTYGKGRLDISKEPKVSDLLDRWILARLRDVSFNVGDSLDSYDVMKAAGELERFLIEDVSRWYIRRSRRRFQRPESAKDLSDASATLAYVLLCASRLMAPCAPFFSEALYQSLAKEYRFDANDSVHLETWFVQKRPTKSDEHLLMMMEEVRELTSLVLAQRTQEGIKVRQPLGRLTIRSDSFSGNKGKALRSILSEEVNVKEVVVDSGIKELFVLDTKLTPELKSEGTLREVVRMIQGLRQNAGYTPGDTIRVWVATEGTLVALVNTRSQHIKSEVNATAIEMKKPAKFDAEQETKFDGVPLWIGITKVKK